MKKKVKLYIVLALIIHSRFISLAQQDPHYTQYMYNMSVINPAYATDNPELYSFGALYRAQWVGSVGGPTTGTFFGHTALGKNVETGLSIVHDEIGDVVKQTSTFIDFSYTIRWNENSKLALGIKGGATFFSTNFNGFVYSDELPDPAFASNLTRTFPNVGVGAYYFGENYYVGLSAPNLLETKHLERQDGVIATGVESIHYFFTGGYVFNLNSNLKYKPAFMLKAVAGAPVSFDFTSNFLINEVFEIGAGYRFGDAVSGLVNFKISPALRIGYAYDYTVTNLGRFNSGSHEIMLLFDINKTKTGRGYDKSPRFF
jgi:type IX secretion system PorP/SprF family membrane protein